MFNFAKAPIEVVAIVNISLEKTAASAASTGDCMSITRQFAESQARTKCQMVNRFKT